MSRETKIKIDIETKSTESSLKALREELKKVKDEMAGLEEGSDAFLQAAKKGGELQHQIQEINASIRGASGDFGDMLGNIAKVGAGMTGAFQAAKGAMELMGVESENVTKAIKDMQSVMAMTQGLAAIDQAIKSLKKLNIVIQSSTTLSKALKMVLQPKSLLLVTAAVTALVAIWDNFHKQIETAIPVIGKVAEYFRGLKRDTDSATEAQENYNAAIAEADKRLEEYLNNKRVKKMNSEARDSYYELSDSINEYQLRVNDIIRQQKELDKELNEGRITRVEYKNQWIELNNEGIRYQEQIRLLKGRQRELLNSDSSYIQKQKEKTSVIKETTKAVKEQKDTFIEDAYAEIEYNKAINEEYAKSKTALEDLLYVQEQELASLEQGSAAWYRLAASIEETKKSISTYGQVEKETKNYKFGGFSIDTTTGFDTQLESLKTQKEAELELIQYYYNQGLIKKEEYEQAYSEIERESVERSKQIQDERLWAITDTAAAASNLLAGILEGIADQQDQSNKEGFEKAKKLQIAAATIQMLTGIATAMAGAFTTKTGPWDIAIAAVQAATIAASGAFQIAKIKNTKFDSASTGVSASGMSSSAMNSFVAPVQYTQDVQGGSISEAIGNTKVYVTESDISRTQNKVSVVENENRY